MKKQFALISVFVLTLASCQSGHMRIFNKTKDNVFTCNEDALIEREIGYQTRANTVQSKLNQKLVKGTVELRHPQVREIINQVERAKADIRAKYVAASSSCQTLATCANENDLNFCAGMNRDWARADVEFEKLDGQLKQLEAGVDNIDNFKLAKKKKLKVNSEKKCETVVGTVFTECVD